MQLRAMVAIPILFFAQAAEYALSPLKLTGQIRQLRAHSGVIACGDFPVFIFAA